MPVVYTFNGEDIYTLIDGKLKKRNCSLVFFISVNHLVNSYKLTSNVTFNYNLDNLDQRTLSSLNILNELGKQNRQSLNWEDCYCGKIIETIRDGIDRIDKVRSQACGF